MTRLLLLLLSLVLSALALLPPGPASAAKVSDISNTRHNLSASGPGPVKATAESQICVFCHTPHAAEDLPGTPLWNRKLSGATYQGTTYNSSSIEASIDELSKGPTGLSKLCLSCHDGTMAIGSVNVLNGKANQTITMTGTGAGGTMPPGAGLTTGFTRNLGVNLSNDHPISFTYDPALAARDGELRLPEGVVGDRKRGQVKPKLPLEDGKMQCTTCHDPHLKETDPTKGVAKFLRLNRLQESPPVGAAFSETGDIFCVACHEKAGQTWALSAHANPLVADEQFNTAAAGQREFPANLPVWRAACLSCHDTHTVQGARRLLREGTDSAGTPKTGGNPAIEETCYQCHSSLAQGVLTNVTQVPNIKDDFSLPRRMPIRSTEQQTGGEVHDIGTGTGVQRGKDFVEAQANLGKGNLANRHVECTDCHNPHRVTKNRLFNADPTTADAAGTHNHAAGHTNIASGVLKGAYGVEPVYPVNGAAFGTVPDFQVKRGDGGAGASTAVGSAWVTREYQVCLKCHSTYAYDTPPRLGDSGGGTPSGTNGVVAFTDQAMEFQAPETHRGQVSRQDSGAYAGNPPGQSYTVNFRTNNHRSWHPVIGSTGRDHATRGTTTASWRAPWNAAADVGSQTMYCSDCHGSNTAADTVVPAGGEDGSPWGPHGSSNNFILKGTWDAASGSGQTNTLCFKCHNPTVYAGTGSARNTGFYNADRGNLHGYHMDKIGRIRCTWCHIAVPHGWKNKAFLVNLNDVGPEAGLAPGTQVRNGTRSTYSAAPYYLNAVLKVRTFATSGNWSEANCGSVGAPGNGQSGRDWMRDSSEACANAP